MKISSQEDAILAAQNDNRLTSVDDSVRRFKGPDSVLEEYNNIQKIRTDVDEGLLIIDTPNQPTKFDKF